MRTIELAFIIASTILSGCMKQSQPLSVTPSLITGDPCAPPCWYGVTPGESTIEDVQSILPMLEFIDTASIQETYPQEDGWVIRWEGFRPAEGGSISFDISGVTTQVIHEFGGVVELQNIIEVRGEPDVFLDMTHPASSEWIIGAEPYIFGLFWWAQGFDVHIESEIAPEHGDLSSLFTPGMLVDSVRYTTPLSQEELGPLPEDYGDWPGYAEQEP
jgi:hypothetical protein